MILAVANQKGGVGKTTTAVNVAAAIADKGKKVLLIDSDPQGNASTGLGIEKNKVESTVYDILVNSFDAKSAVIKRGSLDVIPANIDLAGAEIEIAMMNNKESVLKKAIDGLKEEYDYIIIDAPPSLGMITINALVASDMVLVPIQAEYYALEGLSQLVNTINLVKKGLNPKIEIEGVVLTMFDGRTNLSTQVAEEVKKYFGKKVHKTYIPRNVRLGEAPSYGMTIVEYDRRCSGAEAYFALADEIIENTDRK